MHLAGGVTDDQRRAVISLGFGDGLDRLGGVGSHGDLGDIDVAVLHRDFSQALFLDLFSGSRELGDLSDVRSLRSLSAGVGIDLGVEDEDVDVLLGGNHVVQTAVADIIGPAVSSEDPDGLLCQVVLLGEDFLGLCSAHLLEGRDIGLCGLGIGVSVLQGVDPLLGLGLDRGALFDQSLSEGHQVLTDLVLSDEHSQTVLGVVLKQRVAPCRSVTFGVRAVRGSRCRSAPDRGTTGGVGDVHPVAEQLGDQTGIGSLGTARAGTGELEQGLAELAALDGVVLHVLFLGDVRHAVVEYLLGGQFLFLGNHAQGVDGTGSDADAATHTIQRRNSQGELVDTLALSGLDVLNLCLCGSSGGLGLGQGIGPDRGVRADVGAVVALDTLGRIPAGHGDGYTALLIGGGTELELPVDVVDKGGNRQTVAVHPVDRLENRADHLDQRLGSGQLGCLLLVRGVGPFGGNGNLLEGGGAEVDGLVVHVDDVLSLLQIGLGRLFLHVGDGLLLGHYLCQGEEGALEDGVRPLAHSDLLGQVDCVNRVELDLVLGDVLLGGGVQVVLQFLGAPLAVDHEDSVRLDVLNHLEPLGDVAGVVAGDEVGLVDVVRRADRLVTESQVGDGHAAGLLRVVLEVGLDILVGVVSDDLDRVLVGSDGSVSAQSPELAFDGSGSGGIRGLLVLGEAQSGHVVDDSDGEEASGLDLFQFLVNGEHGGRRGVLRAQSVAASADLDVIPSGIGQGGDDILIQRLTVGSRFLGPVEDRYLLSGGGDSLDKLFRSERPVQSDLYQTDLLAL